MAAWKPGDPSPYVSPYIARKQAEGLLELVRQQSAKRWRAVEKALLRGLRKNANGKEYPDADT